MKTIRLLPRRPFLLLCATMLALAPAGRAATITVTSTADAGAGTLRSAVASANPGDTVNFAAALAGQTITLTTTEIGLNKNLTIDGSTLSNSVTISGNQAVRIFHVTNGTVTIGGITLTGGNADPGA